jgi:glutamine synthetase
MNVLEKINAFNAKFVDLRFTDLRGKEHHLTIPVEQATSALFEKGKPFDGSSIAGWASIDKSDLLLLPDPATMVMDPFYQHPTIVVRCNVVDPETMQAYTHDPREVARRAETYLHATGIADNCFIGPEPEFFILDDVRWENGIRGASYHIDSQEAHWNSNTEYPYGNMGHRPGPKGGYFPVPPVDSSQDIRSEMSLVLARMGLSVETHHHEVATANQNEISTEFGTLLKKADEIQTLKYVIRNVAHSFGKTVTFMPKPLVGDNGSGMHCHFSLGKDNKNLFAGDQYAGLSETALFAIGGIIKHARALNVFTNPGTNSYKRLVPGFEAPVMLAYSMRNRSAAIRVPYVSSPNGSRIEVRFPDATANPYLAFSAILMAALDGIKHRIFPGDPMDKDLYHLSEKETKHIPTVCHSLEQAIDSLLLDHAFLLEGDVFTKSLIEHYVMLKMEEITKLRMATHPIEFDMYYSS